MNIDKCDNSLQFSRAKCAIKPVGSGATLSSLLATDSYSRDPTVSARRKVFPRGDLLRIERGNGILASAPASRHNVAQA